jgi:hypothetical protein
MNVLELIERAHAETEVESELCRVVMELRATRATLQLEREILNAYRRTYLRGRSARAIARFERSLLEPKLAA